MFSTKVVTVLALMAASVSGMSIGHPSNLEAHRRHASEVTHNSVLQARAARQRDMSGFAKLFAEEEAAKRDVPRRVRKRGTNARRCAVKSSSSLLPSSTPVPANVGGDPTESATTPEPTSTSVTTTPVETSAAETTSKAQPTKTSPTKTASKTSSAVKPTETPSNDDGGSSSGGSFTGEGTFYATGLGACGITNVDTDFICAVSQSLFDGFEGYTGGNPNKNPICGRKIKATFQGKTVSVTVTDRCVGCAVDDLDFSPSAFDKLASQSVGRLKGMTWSWA